MTPTTLLLGLLTVVWTQSAQAAPSELDATWATAPAWDDGRAEHSTPRADPTSWQSWSAELAAE